MTDEEMDRLVDRVRGDGYTYDEVERDIRAALRQAADESLNEVRQYVEAMPVCTRVGVLRLLDDLKSPAAAPAADYDPITAPIPEGDMNGPHGPRPSEPVAPAPSCTCKWRLEQSIRHAPDCPVVASPTAQGKGE